MSIKRKVSILHGGRNSAHRHILHLWLGSNQTYSSGASKNKTQISTVKQRRSKTLWVCSSSMITSASDSLKATIDQPEASSPRKVKMISKPHGLLLATNFWMVYSADSEKNCSSLEQPVNSKFPLCNDSVKKNKTSRYEQKKAYIKEIYIYIHI